MLGLIRLAQILLGEKHPVPEELEKRKDELERILREEPERFRGMIEKYSTRLLLKLMESSNDKLRFDPSYTPMVAWDIVEDVIDTAVRMGILRRVKGIQGEYIDVNPAFVERLGKYDTYNLWGLWLAKELGLPKEVWLDVVRILHPSFTVYGTTPAEIDGIKRYIRGDREGALRIWRNAGVPEDTIRRYDFYLGFFMEDLERKRIKRKAREIIEKKERQLAGVPKWFSDYLVGQRIAELEGMERVHPDLFEVNVIVPVRTAYRVLDWAFKRLVQRGEIGLAQLEAFVNKLVRRGGYDPRMAEIIRSEIRSWVAGVGEGRLREADMVSRVRNARAVMEALLEKLTPLLLESRAVGRPLTREEVLLVKRRVREIASSLQFT